MRSSTSWVIKSCSCLQTPPSSRMITPPSSHSRAQHVIITYTNTDLFLSSSKRRKQKKFSLFLLYCCYTFFGGGRSKYCPRWPWWCWALGWAIHRDSFSSSFVGFLIEPGVVVLCFPLTWLCKVCWYSNNVNIIMLTSTPTPLPLSIHQTRCQTRSCDLLLFYFHRTRKTFF